MKEAVTRLRTVSFQQNRAARSVGRSFSETIAVRLKGNPAERGMIHLTPRELEVLSLLCEGLPNKLISRRLGISGGTVKVHVARILAELGVTNRLQAVVAAQRLGVIADRTDVDEEPPYSAGGGERSPDPRPGHELRRLLGP